MKKITAALIFILFCVVPLSLWAQNSAIDKGSFEFGLGNALGFSLYTGARFDGDLRTTNITIGSGETRLNAGYFIFDNRRWLKSTTIDSSGGAATGSAAGHWNRLPYRFSG